MSSSLGSLPSYTGLRFNSPGGIVVAYPVGRRLTKCVHHLHPPRYHEKHHPSLYQAYTWAKNKKEKKACTPPQDIAYGLYIALSFEYVVEQYPYA